MTSLPDWHGPLPRALWAAIDTAAPGYLRRTDDLRLYALTLSIRALADGDDEMSDVWLDWALRLGTMQRWAARRAS